MQVQRPVGTRGGSSLGFWSSSRMVVLTGSMASTTPCRRHSSKGKAAGGPAVQAALPCAGSPALAQGSPAGMQAAARFPSSGGSMLKPRQAAAAEVHIPRERGRAYLNHQGACSQQLDPVAHDKRPPAVPAGSTRAAAAEGQVSSAAGAAPDPGSGQAGGSATPVLHACSTSALPCPQVAQRRLNASLTGPGPTRRWRPGTAWPGRRPGRCRRRWP